MAGVLVFFVWWDVNPCVVQEGDFLVRTHHVEYCDGGILDPDDVLSDLVEDKDKVRLKSEWNDLGMWHGSLNMACDAKKTNPTVEKYWNRIIVWLQLLPATFKSICDTLGII